MPGPDLFSQAVAHARAERYVEARETLDRLLAKRPQDAAAWAMRGSLDMELGQPQTALQSYDRALALRPGHAATEVNRANALSRLERHLEAIEGFDRAIAADPALVQAHANRAWALVKLNRYEEAQADARRATVLSPAYPKGWNHLGLALQGLGQYEAASEAFSQACARDGGSFDSLNQLGSALVAVGRPQEAIAAYDRAVRQSADASTALFGRAQARLLVGDYRGGWQDYEHRWRTEIFRRKAAAHAMPALLARLKLWPTPQDLAGRSVIVVSEQGVGDEIMFASVLPDLTALAASVALVCDPRLARLFRHSFPGVDVFGLDAAPRSVDAYEVVVPAGSLAAAFRNAEGEFPGEPYLRPGPQVADAWRARLGPSDGRRRIGVSWKGGVDVRAGFRSMPLEALRPLLEREDCAFVSLQYGEVADEVAAFNATLARPIACFPRAEIDDFEQLAGLVSTLDLVVSVQNTTVHLAGALGKTCWAMVPKWPEWRYRVAGETMPWYRSVRLFRQGKSEAWPAVVARVVEALADPGVQG